MSKLESIATQIAEKATGSEPSTAPFFDITAILAILSELFSGCGQSAEAFAQRAKQPTFGARIRVYRAFREEGYRGMALRQHVNASWEVARDLDEAEIVEAAGEVDNLFRI